MTNQLEIRHFEYFLALAENLHYRKAAEQLFISQSALSQQIRRLENILGKDLFIRTNRKVALSPAGVLFQKEALIITNQIEQSMERWQLVSDGGEGILRIGFVGSAMQHYLPKVLKIFTFKHPKIKLYLEDLSNKDQLEALEKNELDIGFVRSNDVSDRMNIKSILKENFSLVLPVNHHINEDNFKNMEQFSNEAFILFPNERSQMYYQQILGLCNDNGFSPQIAHRSIHAPTIFKLVESGLGISIIPNSLRDDFNYNIRFIELKNIKQKTELFAVWHKEIDNMALPNFLKILD